MRKKWGHVVAAALKLKKSGAHGRSIKEMAAAALAKAVHGGNGAPPRHSIGQPACNLEAPSASAFAAVAKAAAARRLVSERLKAEVGSRSSSPARRRLLGDASRLSQRIGDATRLSQRNGNASGDVNDASAAAAGKKPAPPMRQRTQRLTPQQRRASSASSPGDAGGRRRSVWRAAAQSWSAGLSGSGSESAGEPRRPSGLQAGDVSPGAVSLVGSHGPAKVAPHPSSA